MKKLPLAILFSLIFSVSAYGQQPLSPTTAKTSYAQPLTATLDASIGGGSIGYNPDVNFGGSLTIPVGKRLELYADAMASPFTKSGYSGYTLVGDGRTIFWLTPKVAGFVGVVPSYVVFGNVHKHAINGLAGVVIRDHWNPNSPGRLVLAYEQEIDGCVWATATNPCPLTSSEFIGGRVSQEFRMNSRFRFGIDGAVGRINQQINPNAPQAGALYGLAVSVELTFRFTLRKDAVDVY